MKKLIPLIFFVIVLSSYVTADITTDIYGAWKFDLPTPNASEEAGWGWQGYPVLTPVTGKDNEAYDYSTESPRLENQSENSRPDTFSSNMWVNPDTIDATINPFLSKSWTGDADREFGLRRLDDDLDMYYSVAGTDTAVFSCDNIIKVGVWQMITFTMRDNNLTLYYNGTQCNSVVKTMFDGNGYWSVGSMGDLGYWEDGKIDELTMWSKTLTGEEVTELYNGGDGVFYPFTTPDVTDPASNITINDSTPKINDVVNLTLNVSDDIELSYCWFFNNQSKENSSIISLSGGDGICTNLTTINTTQGNDVLFIGYVNDTSGNLNFSEVTITVANTAPTVGTPIINSSPSNLNTTNQSLACYNTSQSDVDGDVLVNSYRWFKNTVEQTSLITSTVAISNTAKTESWICEVNVSDSSVQTRTNSTTLTILNSLPFINITIDDININSGDSLNKDAINCTDVDGDTITYYVNDTMISVSAIGILTDTPLESESGIYTINASCDDGTINDSQLFTYTVNDLTKPKSNISINDTTPKLNGMVNISLNVSDGNALSYCWFYNNQSKQNSSLISLSGQEGYCFNITTINTSQGNNILFIGYVNDSSGNLNFSEVTITIESTAPTVGTPIINSTPSNQNLTANDLTCFNTSQSDADGDALTTSYEWFKDGAKQTSLTTSTAGNANTAKGEDWLCQINVSDGTLQARENSTTLTILNTAPSSATTINPSTTHSLTQSMSWTEGSDGDSDTVSTFWCVGTSADICDVHTETEIANPPHSFAGGELTYGGASKTYYFNLTSYDGTDRGTVYKSTFTLTNAQPSAPSNTDTVTTHNLNPTIGFDKGTDTDTSPADTVLQFVSVDTTAYKDDGDTLVTSGDINSFAPTLAYSGESRTYYVRIYSNDTTTATNERSNNYQFTLTLTNAVPTVSVIINSTPSNLNLTANDLTCFNFTGDSDNDALTISYNWYKDDAEQTSLSTNTVGNANTAKGEDWICQVNASDGLLQNKTNSTTLTILNTAPTVCTINVTGNYSVNSNESIGCTGSTDADVDTITINVWYNTSVDWWLYSSSTDTNFTLNVTTDGEIIYYKIETTDGTDGINTSTQTITVDFSSPTISWTSPSSILTYTTQSVYTINGTCSDTRYVHSFNSTVFNESGVATASTYFDFINQSSFTNATNFTLNSNQNNTVMIRCYDQHTGGKIDKLSKGKKGESVIVFNDTSQGAYLITKVYFVEKDDKLTDTPSDFTSFVDYVDKDGNVVAQSDATKIKFGGNFTVVKPETKIIYNLTSNVKLKYLAGTDYAGHIIWIPYVTDFEGATTVKVNGIDEATIITVTVIDDYNIQVKIEGATQWRGNDKIFIDPETDGLNKVEENRTIVQDSTNPAFSNFKVFSLNSSNEIIGDVSTFNLSNLREIEKMVINFTLDDVSNISNVTIFFTANGTDACALGNNQSSTCYNYDSGTWIEYILGGSSNTFVDWGQTGDFINCTYSGSESSREYSCIMDEHYNPNVWKHYPLNFSDLKYQEGINQAIKQNVTWKIEIDQNIVPLVANEYKLDFRINATGSPTQPVKATFCNSSYTTGDISTDPKCQLVGSKLPSELQDDGTKFRAIFTRNLTRTLGDIKYVFITSDELSGSYAMKTYKYLGSDGVRVNISTDDGNTFSQLADGYETELNINWFYNGTDSNSTQIVFKFQSNDTLGNLGNTSEQVVTWLPSSINQPPIVDIITPTIGSKLNGITTINWTTAEPEGNNYLTNISLINGSTTTVIISNLASSISNYTWNTSLYDDKKYNLSVISCETGTADGFCGNDTNEITIDNTAPAINLESPTNNLALSSPSMNFRYNVSDFSAISACQLYVDNALQRTNTTITKDASQNYTAYTITTGTHNWLVSCNDSLGNIRNSTTLNFSVSISTTTTTADDTSSAVSGVTSPATGYCGNNICESSESASFCPEDCSRIIRTADFPTVWFTNKQTELAIKFTDENDNLYDPDTIEFEFSDQDAFEYVSLKKLSRGNYIVTFKTKETTAEGNYKLTVTATSSPAIIQEYEFEVKQSSFTNTLQNTIDEKKADAKAIGQKVVGKNKEPLTNDQKIFIGFGIGGAVITIILLIGIFALIRHLSKDKK